MTDVNTASTIDITTRRGDTKPYRFTASDVNGDADITGFSFLMTVTSIKNPPDNTTQVFQMSGTIIQNNPGIIDFPPGSSDTDLEPGTYYYDIQVTDTAGKIHTPILGKFKITQDRTKN